MQITHCGLFKGYSFTPFDIKLQFLSVKNPVNIIWLKLNEILFSYIRIVQMTHQTFFRIVAFYWECLDFWLFMKMVYCCETPNKKCRCQAFCHTGATHLCVNYYFFEFPASSVQPKLFELLELFVILVVGQRNDSSSQLMGLVCIVLASSRNEKKKSVTQYI